MNESDEVLSRVEEDILDAMNPADFSNVSPETKQKIINKKDLRALEP